MDRWEGFAGLPKADDSGVERIPQDRHETGEAEGLTLAGAQALLRELVKQWQETDFARRVAPEGEPHERSAFRVDNLHLAALALIEVAKRSTERVDALLQ